MAGGELLLSKVVTAVVLGAMARAALRRAPTTFDGNPMLVHGRVMGGLAFVFAVLMPTVVGFLCVVQPPRDAVGVRNVIGIYALLFGLGLPLWWEWLRFYCVMTERGLDYRSPWTGRHSIAMEEVASLTYSALNAWFVLTTRDGRRHRISTYAVGIRQFTAYCRRHWPSEVWRGAVEGFAAVEDQQ